jgi:hypothetical protein
MFLVIKPQNFIHTKLSEFTVLSSIIPLTEGIQATTE